MVDIIKEWMVPNVPREFWKRLEEGQTDAFAEAYQIASKYAAPPEFSYFLGQARHTRSEKAFRQIGEEAGMDATALGTIPPGGSFSVIEKDGLHILRGNIQPHCGIPRATKFRREMAAYNEWLNPQQLDLFLEKPKPPSDKLCAMLIVTRPPRGGDPTVPSYIGVGVPSDDLSMWMGGPWKIGHIIAAYSVEQHPPTPIPPELKDKAIPRLKDE